ncbi:MAG: hypothetical protein QNJ94_19765 [Alphaproteobacteria bacterium]|nr:hypothetical protein [Alphaproteobacteria bacterium]
MTPSFLSVFEELRAILLPYAQMLECKTDRPGDLYIDTRHIMKNGKPLFFGSAQVKKRYVSYHLMPVYVNPALLDSVSPGLKKRMQGKSCFQFRAVDQALFAELAELTRIGFEDYRRQGYV